MNKIHYMGTKWISHFVLLIGVILLVVAIIRFMIAAGNAQILSLPDPVLGIPLRYAVLAIGTLELAAALLCLFRKTTCFRILLVAWLSTNFVLYRFAALWMHCKLQTTCIGSITDPLHVASRSLRWTIEGMPFLGLLGSCGALICFWRDAVSVKTSESLKIFCPSCGAKINFATQDIGRKTPCPLCKTKIQLRKLEFLKMSCTFCKENIEFPSHALGRKISCPHCNMNVTLKESS